MSGCGVNGINSGPLQALLENDTPVTKVICLCDRLKTALIPGLQNLLCQFGLILGIFCSEFLDQAQ